MQTTKKAESKNWGAKQQQQQKQQQRQLKKEIKIM